MPEQALVDVAVAVVVVVVFVALEEVVVLTVVVDVTDWLVVVVPVVVVLVFVVVVEEEELLLLLLPPPRVPPAQLLTKCDAWGSCAIVNYQDASLPGDQSPLTLPEGVWVAYHLAYSLVSTHIARLYLYVLTTYRPHVAINLVSGRARKC